MNIPSAIPHLHASQSGTAIPDAGSQKKRRVTLTTASQPVALDRPKSHFERALAGPSSTSLAGGANAAGEWDYLLERYKSRGNDEGEEDHEDEDMLMEEEDDDDSSEEAEDIGEEEELVDEMEIDPADKQPHSGTMSVHEVADIINECITAFTNAWYPGKVSSEYQPIDIEKLLRKAESDGQRQHLEQLKRDRIDYLEHHLDTLADEISSSNWRNAKNVRYMCHNLETTVESLEYEKWLLEQYELRGGGAINPATQIIDLGSGSNSPEADLVFATDRLSVDIQSMAMPTDLDISEPLRAAQLQDRTFHTKVQSELSRTQGQTQPHQQPVQASNQSRNLGGPGLTPNPSRHQHEELIPLWSQESPRSTFNSSAKSSRPPQLSDPSLSQRTYASQGTHPTPTKHTKVQPHNRDSPELASISTVAKWGWKNLVETRDRKRIIMKLISQMNDDDRETLRTRIASVKKQHILMEIPKCIGMLLRKENKIQGILPRDLPKIVMFTRLFLSWWLADNYFLKEPEPERLQELAHSLEQQAAGANKFYDFIRYIMEHTFSKKALEKPAAPSQAEVIVISDSDDDTPKPKPTPPRKRQLEEPRSIKKSPAAKGTVIFLD